MRVACLRVAIGGDPDLCVIPKKHQPPPRRGLVMVVRRFGSTDPCATRTRRPATLTSETTRMPRLRERPRTRAGWGMTPNPFVDVVKGNTFVLLLFPRRCRSRSRLNAPIQTARNVELTAYQTSSGTCLWSEPFDRGLLTLPPQGVIPATCLFAGADSLKSTRRVTGRKKAKTVATTLFP